MQIPKGSGGRVEEAGRSTDWVPRDDLELVRVSRSEEHTSELQSQ